jgi:hypothetical protein
MLTYLFNVEIISLNPSAEDCIVDIDHDTVDVLAVDEPNAILALKERFNVSTEFLVRGVNSFELLGTYEEETF